MPKCYYKTECNEVLESFDDFADCKICRAEIGYVICISAEVKKYFEELLYYRFLYVNNEYGDLYLIWDNRDDVAGLESQKPHTSSVRFFNVMKYIWNTNKGIKNEH